VKARLRAGDVGGRFVEIASIGQSRQGLARLGAAAFVGLLLLVTLVRLFDDALPGQNHWATLNSEHTYAQRTFPSDEFIGSARVAEDARLWMPRDARYRILVGPGLENSPWSYAAPGFLTGFLLPRRRVFEGDAPWVICIRCDRSTTNLEVLSDGGNGIVFGRLRA
jgi:hypothetical protein